MMTIDNVYAYKEMLIILVCKRIHNIEIAEDIVQDVFIKAISKMNTFTTEEHCKAWLIRCTINRVKTAYYRYVNSAIDITELNLLTKVRNYTDWLCSTLGLIFN